MDFGAHLPLLAFDHRPYSLDHLLNYTEVAAQAGFRAIAANDHLIFSRPWLDGLTALAAVLSRSQDMTIATTVTLPVVRGPVPLAKTLAALDLLSGGRLLVGIGPGSSPRDYAAVGIPFEERWKRLDGTIRVLRALLNQEHVPFKNRVDSSDEIVLEPAPAQKPGPPLWIGSRGSNHGLWRAASLGDGWLASAYNMTPEQFSTSLDTLRQHLCTVDKDPLRFPNAIATMLLYVTEDRHEAEGILDHVLSPTFERPADELNRRLLIGPAEESAAKLAAYQAAGTQRVYVWPVADEIWQLHLFQEQVVPLIRHE